MAYSNLPVLERFYNKVEKSDNPDGCWLWTGSISKAGYGVIGANGKGIYTHRFIYEHFKGTIPDGMFVCHTCDNPACCNPAHLWLGTHKENMRDMARKERAVYQRHPEKAPRGEQVTQFVKLTAQDVREIRRRNALGGVSYLDLAQQYGVDRTNIGCIVRRVSWKHIE